MKEDICEQVPIPGIELHPRDNGALSKPFGLAVFLLYLLLFVFWVYRSAPRIWVFVGASLAFLPTLLLKDKRTSGRELIFSIERILSRVRPRHALLAACLALVLYLAIGYWGGHGFTPHSHDEFAYIFQAKTFAEGRVAFPAPPIPEFFESFHILTEGIYASKYPPGQALVMLPGVLLGIPILMSITMSVGSLFLLYFIVRQIQNDHCALICLVLFALSPLQIQQATSHLSHTSSLFFLLLFVYWSINAWEKSRIVLAFCSGAALGLAFLVRPLTSVAVAFPFITWDIWVAIQDVRKRRYERAKQFLAGAFAFGGIAGLLFLYNFLLMGDPLRFPWVEYMKRYIPMDAVGFHHGTQAAVPQHELSPLMLEFNRGFVEPMKRAYSFWGAVKQFWFERLPHTIYMSDDTFGLAALVPFAFLVPLLPQERLFLASAISLFFAHFFYYGSLARYHFEIAPFLVYFFVKGTLVFSRLTSKIGSGLLQRFLLFHLISGIVVALPYNLLSEYYFKLQFTQYHAEFRGLVQKLTDDPKLIFVRYSPGHSYLFDLINNEPDLKNSRVIYVHDLGERNKELMKFYPERTFYRFDEGKWEIQRLKD